MPTFLLHVPSVKKKTMKLGSKTYTKNLNLKAWILKPYQRPTNKYPFFSQPNHPISIHKLRHGVRNRRGLPRGPSGRDQSGLVRKDGGQLLRLPGQAGGRPLRLSEEIYFGIVR